MINNLLTKLQQQLRKVTGLSKGFTLVEMLVAVLLLVTAVAGPLTIASRGITASLVAKDQVTAFMLAQDAIEYLRFQRDTNKLAGNDWLLGIEGTQSPGGCESSSGCILDATGNSAGAGGYAIIPCSNSGTNDICTTPIRYNSSLYRYTYLSGAGISQTIFRRHIKLTQLSATEAQFEVRIIWCYQNATAACVNDESRADRWEIVVKENLHDWN